MKPNLAMQPNVFDAPYVRTRIAAAGSLAALKFTKKLQGGSELQVSTLARLRRPPHAAALPAELRDAGAANCDDVEFARALLGCLGLPPHTLRMRDEDGSPRVEIASGLLPFLVDMEAQGAAADAAAAARVAELATAVRHGESAAARRQAERGATKYAAEQRATQLREAAPAPPPSPRQQPPPVPGPRHAPTTPPKPTPKPAPTKPTQPTKTTQPIEPTGPKAAPKCAPVSAPTLAPTLAPRLTPQPRPMSMSAPQSAPQHTPKPAPATRPTVSEPLTPPSMGQEMTSFSVAVDFTNPLLGKMNKEEIHRKMSYYAELERNSSATAAAATAAPTAKEAKGGVGVVVGGGSAFAAQQMWLRSNESDEQAEKEVKQAKGAQKEVVSAAPPRVFTPLDPIGAQALPGGGAKVSTRGDTMGVEGVAVELPFLRTNSFLAGNLSMRGRCPVTDTEEVVEQEEQEEMKVPWSMLPRMNSAAELAGIGAMLRKRKERAEWHEARERRVAALRAARAAAASVAPRRPPLPLVAGDSISQVMQHL